MEKSFVLAGHITKTPKIKHVSIFLLMTDENQRVEQFKMNNVYTKFNIMSIAFRAINFFKTIKNIYLTIITQFQNKENSRNFNQIKYK